MSVRAINVVKTVVLERFQFFHIFTNLVSRGMFLGDILVPFDGPGVTVLDFRGYHNRDRNRGCGRDRGRAALGATQILRPHQVEGNSTLQGGSKLTILPERYKSVSCKFRSLKGYTYLSLSIYIYIYTLQGYKLPNLQTISFTAWWPTRGRRIYNDFCYINGHHNQYILVGTIFNYMFHVGLQEHVFKTVRKIHLLGTGSAGAKKVCFEDLSKDVFLEVQNKKCS